jgi:hypothetical protein
MRERGSRPSKKFQYGRRNSIVHKQLAISATDLAKNPRPSGDSLSESCGMGGPMATFYYSSGAQENRAAVQAEQGASDGKARVRLSDLGQRDRAWDCGRLPANPSLFAGRRRLRVKAARRRAGRLGSCLVSPAIRLQSSRMPDVFDRLQHSRFGLFFSSYSEPIRCEWLRAEARCQRQAARPPN